MCYHSLSAYYVPGSIRTSHIVISFQNSPTRQVGGKQVSREVGQPTSTVHTHTEAQGETTLTQNSELLSGRARLWALNGF